MVILRVPQPKLQIDAMETKKKKLVISSGAGISAESGINTFRDVFGQWENTPLMDMATAEGFAKNPELVHRFYNHHRKEVLTKQPNEAHRILAELEKEYDVYIITINIDDLHERAGSKNVLHLHGELMKMRSVTNPDYFEVLDMEHLETTPETRGKNGNLMRPDIVFFNEPVPNIPLAMQWVHDADIFVIVGSSLSIYPSAGLLQCVRPGTPIYYIEPKPAESAVAGVPNLHIIKATATEGMKELKIILE